MSEGTFVDKELADMFAEVFGRWRAARPSAPGRLEFDPELWSTLAGLGVTRLTDKKGSAAGWLEAAELLRAAARHAAPVPLAENDLLAGWLLECAGLADHDKIRTACVLDENGSAQSVPWTQSAERLAVVWTSGFQAFVADLDVNDAAIEHGHDFAGHPRGSVQVDTACLSGVEVHPDTIRGFAIRASLARTIQVTGAMDRIVELSIQHANERHQFGRALAKFQAVQHLVADAAAEAALANAATDAAVLCAVSSADDFDPFEFATALARSVVGHAASVVVRNAHQVHGAIGTTLEHQLQEFTKPALSWRSEYGSLNRNDAFVARHSVASEDGVWRRIVGSNL
jgi:acyl-CoA dehydrogenase